MEEEKSKMNGEGQVEDYDPENPRRIQRVAQRCGKGSWSWVRANKLLVFTLFGIIIGMALGFGLHPYNLSDETILAIGFPGDIFMRALKLLILPLIITSLVTGTFKMRSLYYTTYVYAHTPAGNRRQTNTKSVKLPTEDTLI